MLHDLVSMGLVTHRPRDDLSSMDDYKKILLSCWCIWNNPETGGMTSKHVKARILEAALAGCIVLEEKGSPTAQWFDEGRDYLTYETADDVRNQMAFIRNNPVEARLIAERMATKVRRMHSPKVFWSKVEKALDFSKPFKPSVPDALPIRVWGNGHALPGIQPPMLASQRPSIPGAPMPRLLIAINGHNVVCHDGQYYVVPQKLGTVHLDKPIDRSKPGIRRFSNEIDARNAVGLK
jgi:hypothetical protein